MSVPMPDVGRAILLNQVNPEKQREKRMADLDLHRKETYAIRDLWRNLQRHRARRYQSHQNGLSACRLRELQDLWQHDRVSHHDSPRPELRGSPRSTEHYHSHKNRPQLRSPDRFSQSAPARRLRQSNDDLIPYHTAITMPPDRGQSAAGFNALNRKLVCNLPNIYDTRHKQPGYATCDVSEWKNEIRKIVPKRPKLFTPASAPVRSLSIIMPPPTDRPEDSSCFFRCTVDKTAGKDKEYMINPEWPSEKYTMDSARSRAHCVYTWNM